MYNPHSIRHERGAALVVSLLMLAILLLVGSGALTTSRIETQVAGNDEKVKQALLAAEYALALGESAVEQAQSEHDVDFGASTEARIASSSGRYNKGEMPKWNEMTWDDRDSVDIRTYFASPENPNLPPLPATLHQREYPRLMFERKHFKPDDLSIGIKDPPSGVLYSGITAHGGRAQWSADERPGSASDPQTTYNARYPSTRIVIQSIYAKRYN
jgi:hypothetical protein